MVNLDFLRILFNIRNNIILDEFASATGDLEDEFVEGRAAEDVDVIGCIYSLVAVFSFLFAFHFLLVKN